MFTGWPLAWPAVKSTVGGVGAEQIVDDHEHGARHHRGECHGKYCDTGWQRHQITTSLRVAGPARVVAGRLALACQATAASSECDTV